MQPPPQKKTLHLKGEIETAFKDFLVLNSLEGESP